LLQQLLHLQTSQEQTPPSQQPPAAQHASVQPQPDFPHELVDETEAVAAPPINNPISPNNERIEIRRNMILFLSV